jgi:hypothetical protein
MSDVTVYDFAVVIRDNNGPLNRYNEDERQDADAVFTREVGLVMETDYNKDVHVELIAVAVRPEYEDSVTLAAFTKFPIEEIQ